MGLRLNQAAIFDIVIDTNEARTVALEHAVKDFLDETAGIAGSALKTGVAASACSDLARTVDYRLSLSRSSWRAGRRLPINDRKRIFRIEEFG